MTTAPSQSCNENGAFTLRELLVVIVVLTLLAGLFVTTARGASRRTKVAQCAANLRQFALATQLYANESRGQVPQNPGWAWDLPVSSADALLSYRMEKRAFYCPGTKPRFNDALNFGNLAAGKSLWTFFGSGSNPHIIGYAMAFYGGALSLSDQNITILPEPPKVNAVTFLPIPKTSERVLLADATISENLGGTPAAPGAAGSFTIVAGGFSPNGAVLPHISPHLKGNLPDGGNIAFKDGHVDWRNFSRMSQRASSGRGFWW